MVLIGLLKAAFDLLKKKMQYKTRYVCALGWVAETTET